MNRVINYLFGERRDSSINAPASDPSHEPHYIPKPGPSNLPVPNGSMALSSYPPLGQVTKAAGSDVEFLVLLEVPNDRAADQWEVALWGQQQSAAQDWSETVLSRMDHADHNTYQLQALRKSFNRIYFTTRVSVSTSFHFTLKYRPSSTQGWRWVRDESGLDDGIVVVAPVNEADSSEPLDAIIHDLNPALKVKSAVSQVSGTNLWALESDVSGVSGDESTLKNVTIGRPWGKPLRWFALSRVWTPWLSPEHGRGSAKLARDAILCSFLNDQGRHLVLLAVSGIGDAVTVLRSDDSGRIVFHIRSDGAEDQTATVLAAVGNDFERTCATVMYHARDLVAATKEVTAEHEEEIKTIQGDIRPEWYENWYDGLGFCTWNALGQSLTEEKVLKAVETLAKNKINIVSLIIDDNWQSLDRQGTGQFQYSWKEFEADAEAFPQGLKNTVSLVREKHPSIQHVAVWHSLLGYWGGISPNGKIAKAYKTLEVERQDRKAHRPPGGMMTVIAEEDVHKFFDDFYAFLESCGIDGVKTDCQYMMDTWASAKARRELTKTYQDAWTISSLRHFSIKVISCMSQVPQIMFYSQLSRNRPAMLCRNSDDFFPNEPGSHPWHIWTNAHNVLFTQHLNILPDWDMFQTVHEWSGFHAAARCISGGPVYITDVPGEHDIDLLRQMTGRTIRGKTVIFRPSCLGRTIDQYVGYHDKALLKIGSYHGRAETGTPILGVFNVSPERLTDIIPLARFFGVISSLRYIVRAHTTGQVTAPVSVKSARARSAAVTVTLDERGYEIFCAHPLTHFNIDGIELDVSNLGLVGKMTGSAAIVSSSFELQENGRIFLDTRLKALGVLGVYISALPTMTVKDNFMVIIQGQPIPPHTVTVSKQEEHVLEIDVEKAWDEMALKPGWSNEVEVKVYFSVDQ